MSSDYQRLNETEFTEVSAVGHSQDSEKSEEAGTGPLTSLVKMQHLKIDK